MLGLDTDSNPVRSAEVNVMGTLNVLGAARVSGVRRVVYASSIAVYGDQLDWGDQVLSESDHGRPWFFYGWHKQLNEASAAFYEENYDRRCIGLRISTVYGEGAPLARRLRSPRSSKLPRQGVWTDHSGRRRTRARRVGPGRQPRALDLQRGWRVRHHGTDPRPRVRIAPRGRPATGSRGRSVATRLPAERDATPVRIQSSPS